jgi:elongation factor P
MLTPTDLHPGARFILDGEPYEVLESAQMKMAQRRPVMQCKLKNLINGNVYERNFAQSDIFEEADLEKMEIKYLYNSKGNYFFCQAQDPSKRFSFTEQRLGEAARFLKPNEIVEGIVFNEKIITIVLPVKVQLKVTEAPPGVKGDSAQGGTKAVTLESGAEVQVPLFIEEGDIVEINTESGDYVKRVEKE